MKNSNIPYNIAAIKQSATKMQKRKEKEMNERTNQPTDQTKLPNSTCEQSGKERLTNTGSRKTSTCVPHILATLHGGWLTGMVNFLLRKTYKLRFFIASPYVCECLHLVDGLRLYVDCRCIYVSGDVCDTAHILYHTRWRILCIHPKLHETNL